MTAYPSAPLPSTPPHGYRLPTCRRCGWPVDQPSETISRHVTSEGTVIYTRCICGRLHVWLDAPGRAGAQVVTRTTDAGLRSA